MSTVSEPLPSHDGAHARKAVLAGIVGNVLEWYDFAVYGYFAASIGRHFFPSEDATSSLIAAFGVFAAGFLMRPLGGLVFGYIGDKLGRNRALVLSVLAMALPTFLIGVLPDHRHIGVAAPILLVVMRLLQGLAVGGEYTTSVVYLVESAAPRHRGFVGSWSPFGATAGSLLGSTVGALVSAGLSQSAVDAWGWRIPFIVGLGVGVLGWLLRRHLPEPHAAKAETSPSASPIREAFRTEWWGILQLTMLTTFLAVGFYMSFVYSVTWMEKVVKVPEARAFDINTVSMLLLLLVIPLGGALSDRCGRKPILLLSSLAGLLLTWPLLWLMHHPMPLAVLVGQIGFAIIIGMFAGALPVTMAERLPVRVRCTALSVSYNLSMGLLGGTTPMVATYLIERSHDDLSPAFYLMIAGAISLVAVLGLRETAPDRIKAST